MPDDDDLATLLAEGTPADPVSDEAPETPVPAEGIEKSEDRIKGFQRLLSSRDVELKETRAALTQMQSAIEEMKLGSMSEEERASFKAQKETEELVALRQKLAIYELASEYPEEVPVYRKLLDAKDAIEQLRILRELRSPVPVKAEAEPVPDEIEPNNPRRTQKGEVLEDGSVMTDELAERMLKSAPRGWFGRGR